jgi:hypothetical protein
VNEEPDCHQRREQQHEHAPHANCHVTNRKLNFVPQLGDVALGRNALAQRLLHRLGMGTSLSLIDASFRQAIDLGELVEEQGIR